MAFLDSMLLWMIIAIIVAIIIFYLATYGLDRYYSSRDQKEEKISSNVGAKSLVPGIGGGDDSGPGNFYDMISHNHKIAITAAAVVVGVIAAIGSLKIFTKQNDEK